MKKLSIRKYASTLGISHTAVAKAIKNGYITKGWDKEERKIMVEEANEEWGNEVKSRKQEARENTTHSTPTNLDFEKISFTPLSSNISIGEARRLKEIYNAELARITTLKEQGIYVEKEKVYSALFEFGKYIRTAFQAIPDRVIDNVLAAKSRSEAHSILSDAIYKTLENLTSTPTLKR